MEWEPRKSELIITVSCVLLLAFTVAFFIIAVTPLKNLMPGYPDKAAMDEMAIREMKIDSLERCMYRWELYSNNLKEVLAGRKPVSIDSVLKAAGYTPDMTAGHTPVPADSILRARMEKSGGVEKESKTSIEGKHFFSPVKGSIYSKFDESLHPYVELSAPGGSSVMAVLDGTVIFKEWNDVAGWCVAVQHEGGIVSIYKNVDNALKNVSDKVSAGTAIAILGRREKDGGGDAMLHFELWNNGVAQDPAHLIKF